MKKKLFTGTCILQAILSYHVNYLQHSNALKLWLMFPNCDFIYMP